MPNRTKMGGGLSHMGLIGGWREVFGHGPPVASRNLRANWSTKKRKRRKEWKEKQKYIPLALRIPPSSWQWIPSSPHKRASPQRPLATLITPRAKERVNIDRAFYISFSPRLTGTCSAIFLPHRVVGLVARRKKWNSSVSVWHGRKIVLHCILSKYWCVQFFKYVSEHLWRELIL